MADHTIVTVQQGQASTDNHPCEEYLDERKIEYHQIIVPLRRALTEGDLEAARVILQAHPKLVRYSINDNLETPLHVVAGGHSRSFVRDLVDMMEVSDLELRNKDGNTAFCLAVISGNDREAKIMFNKNEALLSIRGSHIKMSHNKMPHKKMPLYLAAVSGFHDMVTFLYDHAHDHAGTTTGSDWTTDDWSGVLLKCVQAGIFDIALQILEENNELPRDKHIPKMLLALARKPEAFQVRSPHIISRVKKAIWPLAYRPAALNESKATLLLRLLWKRIMQKHKNSIDDILKGPMTVVEKSKDEKIETYPSPILSTATDMNNTQFLVELIREYRDIMWKKNDDGQTMFHIAVAHRSRDVYTLLLDEIGPKKKDLNLITPITDNQGNNILHLVGKYPKNIDEVPAPFKMHTEILWYKEVEGMLPPLYRQVKNKGGRTPHEQFTIGHKRLLADAMKWIYDTINLSMVISALVCTIGFSVVYSVPGGFDQKNGSPILFRSRYFIAFIAMVAFSFILSSSSILIFLSVILPARNQKNSEVLLKKWVIGQVALSSSVSVMIFAFVFGFSILYINVDESSLYIFYVGAIVLMYIYITMHFPLFKDLLMSIYLPGYLFRPSLRMKIKPVP